MQAAVNTTERNAPMRQQPPATPDHQRPLAVAALWLLVGSVLLLTTVIPLRTDALGWTPAFWLVVAPLTALLGLEPRLPLQLLSLRRSRRPLAHHAMWH
jgi:hypothetical protein